MLAKLLACLCLLAITVAIHATGLVAMLRWLRRSPALERAGMTSSTWLLVRVVWSLMAIHLLEISVWAAFYWWQECLPDAESAFYFSGVTYASIGYGDLLLPNEWRLFGPVEGLTGILMCGLSTGFFFAILSRMHGARASREQR
jgi:hypothetical protein